MFESERFTSEIRLLSDEQRAIVDDAIATFKKRLEKYGLDRCRGLEGEIFDRIVSGPGFDRYMKRELLCGLLEPLSRHLADAIDRKVTCKDLQDRCPSIASIEIEHSYPYLNPVFCEPLNYCGYRVLQTIGEGRQATVKEAISPGGIAKAIKHFPVGSWEARVLRHEFRILQRVTKSKDLGSNPYIIQGVDEASDTEHYVLAVDLVKGKNLEAVTKHQTLDAQAVATLGKCLCSALAHIHNLGVLHLDLSPGNIILRDQAVNGPSPVLIDFGLAFFTTSAHPALFTKNLLN